MSSAWELTPEQVRDLLASDPQTLLLDVREPQEYAVAKIEQAKFVPMGEIKAHLPELEQWDDQPVVVFCHHGVRSLQVTAFLKEAGFENVRSMAGGIDRWSLEIDPAVPRY